MREAIVLRFGAVLARRYGSGYGCEFDFKLQRYAVITPSVAGHPVKQYVVWRRDPATGMPYQPDILGVLPFRELDAACQAEILANMDKYSLTNRHDGAGRWSEQQRQVTEHNDAVTADGSRVAAELFTLGITEADIRRPWLKHHSGSAVQRRIAWDGTRGF